MDQTALDLLGTVLSGSRSSRLVRTLREEKKIVWSVGAGFSTNIGSGYFLVNADFEPDKLEEVKTGIHDVLQQAMEEGFTKEEIRRAKTQIETQWLHQQESVQARASHMATYAMMDRWDLAIDYVKGINKVRDQDLVRVLKEYGQNLEFHTAVLLPHQP